MSDASSLKSTPRTCSSDSNSDPRDEASSVDLTHCTDTGSVNGTSLLDREDTTAEEPLTETAPCEVWQTSTARPAQIIATRELPEDILAAAHWWFEWGLHVAPMNPATKHTRQRWIPWLSKLAAEGHAAIDAEFEPEDHLCAIVDNQVFVLDADTPESAAALHEIEAAHDLAPNLIVQTKNGVHHWFRRLRGTYAKAQGYSSESQPERIDIRTARGLTEGRSVVVLPPSPGKTIEINEADSVANLVEVGQDFIDAIFRHNGQEVPRPPKPRVVERARREVGATQAAEILSYIPPDCGHSDWMAVAFGLYDKFDGSDEGLYLWDHWSSSADCYPGVEELEYKWNTLAIATSEDHVTFGTVCHLAEQHGADLSAIARKYDADGKKRRTFDELMQAADALTGESAPEEIEQIAKATTGLSPIERRHVAKRVKQRAGIPLGTFDATVDQVLQSGELTPIEYARNALAEYGPSNIVYAEGAFWYYPGAGVWAEEQPEGVKQQIHKVTPDEELSGGGVDSVLKLCRTECFDPGARFGEPFDGVNVRNGLLIHNGTEWVLEAHQKDLYLLAQLPVEYDAEADCPRFRRFLDEVFEGDPDANGKVELLLALIGYTLLPTSRFEKFVMLVGNGANGKSVLLEVLAALLGIDNVAGVAPSELEDHHKRAFLHGRLANIVTEIAEGAVINDAVLKALTSGELITADHKHRSPFTFRPYATCWFATNHMPHTRDFSDALFRRACVITFNNKFEGKHCDPFLKDKLLSELPGVLNMALSAIGQVLAGGSFIEPESMLQARHDWRLEADQVLQFIEDCCAVGDGEIERGNLYLHYKGWAYCAGIRRVLTHKSFTNRLERAGVGERRTGSTRYYTGISLVGKGSTI